MTVRTGIVPILIGPSQNASNRRRGRPSRTIVQIVHRIVRSRGRLRRKHGLHRHASNRERTGQQRKNRTTRSRKMTARSGSRNLPESSGQL
jgi:hypothetical protein